MTFSDFTAPTKNHIEMLSEIQSLAYALDTEKQLFENAQKIQKFWKNEDLDSEVEIYIIF